LQLFLFGEMVGRGVGGAGGFFIMTKPECARFSVRAIGDHLRHEPVGMVLAPPVLEQQCVAIMALSSFRPLILLSREHLDHPKVCAWCDAIAVW
jgi:hypothetical protein